MRFSDLSNSIRNGRLMRRACLTAAVCIALLLFSVSAQAQDENNERVTQIPSGPYRIAGTVVNGKTGSVLSRARVTIGDTKQRQSMQFVITGDDGHFEFHVPAGKYSLTGAKRGFVASSYNPHDQYSTAIVTGADLETENLILRLQANAVLTGRVLDENQEPVRNAQVMLYWENHFQGVNRIDRRGGARTDDQGHYEITPLEPGTYFVAVKATPWYAVHPESASGGSMAPSQVDPALDVVYPITYYGDTTETDSAVPIPVRGGDRLEADVHVTPLPSLHLIVHVPDEQSPGAYHVPVLQKPTFDGMEQVESTNVRMISEGVFELSGIAAGRYRVNMPDTTGLIRESSEVDLTSGGELDVSSGALTSTVKIKVQIVGAMTSPPQLQIGLRNNKVRVNALPVDDKGEVTFSNVTPGKYDIAAGSPRQAYSVARIAGETGSIVGHTVNVPAGAALNISVMLMGGSMTVEGFAKRGGKAVAGAMIVLVPKESDADRNRFRRDQSDLDGSFTLRSVIPGSYTVIAIDDGWDLNWSESAVLTRYLTHGETVEVGDRVPSPMRLTDPVDVQGK